MSCIAGETTQRRSIVLYTSLSLSLFLYTYTHIPTFLVLCTHTISVCCEFRFNTFNLEHGLKTLSWYYAKYARCFPCRSRAALFGNILICRLFLLFPQEESFFFSFSFFFLLLQEGEIVFIIRNFMREVTLYCAEGKKRVLLKMRAWIKESFIIFDMEYIDGLYNCIGVEFLLFSRRGENFLERMEVDYCFVSWFCLWLFWFFNLLFAKLCWCELLLVLVVYF